MNLFDVADGVAACFDRVEEIGPQFLDVLVVGLVQFGVFVNHGSIGVDRVKSPAVNPANVKRSVGPVEITADGLYRMRLFGLVSRKFAVFPTDGELVEFVNGYLMIRRVGRLSFISAHYGAGYRAASGRKNSLRIFLACDPENLIKPVNAPIAELAVSVIEELAEAFRVNALV